MVKFFLFLPAAALATCLGLSAPAYAADFEIEENFDNEASFSQGGDLPDGWSQNDIGNFTRRDSSEWYGYPAQSGNYIIAYGSQDGGGVLYTAPVKLAGGNKATLEFSAYMPGGTPAFIRNFGLTIFAGTTANIEDMTQIGSRECMATPDGVQWESLKYEFTPDSDGEYYFAIRVDQNGGMNLGGYVFFDTFFFSGTEPESPDPIDPPGPGPDEPGDPVSTYPGMDMLEPDEENLSVCIELPYFENFSDADHYDNDVLPKGWKSTGSNIWRTANRDQLPAVSGDYYITTTETSTPRDERAYTPFFNLQKGVTYTLAFSTHQMSTLYDEEENIRRITIIRVGAGTQQDSEFIPVTMKEISIDNPAGTWTDHAITFCPAVSGPYCFCFELEGLPYSGIAAIDDVRITSAIDLARPAPDFVPKGIYSIFTSALLAIGDEPVRIVNTSEYAEQVEWKVPEGIVSNVLPNGDIDVFFTESGSYTFELTATNAKGTRTASKTIDVEYMGEAPENQIAVAGYDPNGTYFYNRDNLPRFSTDPEFDFVSGYNHYYNTYAEYYNLPENFDFALRQISVWMPWLNYRTTYGDPAVTDQRIKPFTVKIVGVDENGLPDEEHVFGRLDTTMKDAFGGTGTNELNARDIVFPEPILCKGPIFVIFEYSPELDLEPEIIEFTRSYIAIDLLKHSHKQTTMYVKPYNVPEDVMAEEGKWCPVHDFSRAYKGFGLGFELWTSAPAGAVYTAPVTLQGGKEAAIEFQALIPSNPGIADNRQLGVSVFAGTTPNLAEMTKIGTREPGAADEWEAMKFSFTPEHDANYYYALRIDNCLTHPDAVMLLDSFVFTGSNPDDDSAVEIRETFDNDTAFDAEAVLPRKWKQDNPANFTRSKSSDFSKIAHSGEYVLAMGNATQGSIVAIDSDGNVLFAARYAAGAIEVSGTTEGEWIAVYTTDGKCVAMARADEGFTRIHADIPAGLYIVRGDKAAAKFLK